MNREKLIHDNRRLAYFVARREGFKQGVFRECDHEDLRQAAMIGLCLAAKTWEEARGRFATWAGFQCRAQVQAEIRRLKGKGAERMPEIHPFDDESVGETDDVARELEDRDDERCARVREALAALPIADRQLLLRHFVDDVPCTVIARECVPAVTRQRISHRIALISQRLTELMARVPRKRRRGGGAPSKKRLRLALLSLREQEAR